jgi:L-ribulose-5-phosphate 4-epimerase
MLEELKTLVCGANLELVRTGLVTQTFGNVSGIDRATGSVVIKPSGVPYADLRAANMVVVSLKSGEVIEGRLAPSSDTPTHLVLYRAWKDIGGIVHTHSLYASSWAQAQREIPPLGTTHADYCRSPIPCTRRMTDAEIKTDYEANTGHVIVERCSKADGARFPFVLVAGHGPFAWGASADDAVENAVALEYIARLASETLRVNHDANSLQQELLDKHFFRKHGSAAYYGQRKPA